MEILDLRYTALRKALDRLQSSLRKFESNQYQIDYEELRDSIIQRFEFCADMFWKFLLYSLQEKAGILVESPSPRKVYRACIEAKFITINEFESLLKITEDRNITSHTYNEQYAQAISVRIYCHYNTMELIIARIKSK